MAKSRSKEKEEGTGAGSSGDGLSHRVATGEDEPNTDDNYVEGEAEEGREANGMPSPVVVSKQEKNNMNSPTCRSDHGVHIVLEVEHET